MGTGFCLDPECQVIGTNYHVAMIAKCRKVEGTKIVQRYLATGPGDQDATLNYLASGRSLRYALSRDLAVFELDKPLAHHHGLAFSVDDLVVGQKVNIYAYPSRKIDPFRNLQMFQGTFQGITTTGLLAFDYVPNGNEVIRPGASGGIIVDRNTGRVVGILNGLAADKRTIAVAVPVESLAVFLYKKLPILAELLFARRAQIPEGEHDLYPKYVFRSEADRLQPRPKESTDITDLRKRAQALADGMRNFTAVQTFLWGKGNHQPVGADAFEVQVRDGVQMYRKYPNGKHWLRRSPEPEGASSGISPGNMWSSFPLFIGTEVGVKIHEAVGTELDGRKIRVFQYLGSTEDNPCVTKDVIDLYIPGHSALVTVWKHTYAAYGEVWTDDDLNIIRMSLNCEKHGEQKWQFVADYDWLTRPGIEPQLVPISLVASLPNPEKGLWCRSQFVDYHEFASQARLIYTAPPVGTLPTSQEDQVGNKQRQR